MSNLRLRRVPSWALVVIGIGAALLVAGAIEGIVYTARTQTYAEISRVPLQQRVYQEAALEQSTLYAAMTDSARATLLRTQRGELAAALTELQQRGMEPSALARLRAAVAEYELAVDDALRLRAAAPSSAAAHAASAQVDARLTAIEQLIAAENARTNAIVLRDDRIMELAITATIVVVVLLSGALFWAWERARVNLEQRLLHEATHDGLTGLPNRTLFVSRLEVALREAQRDRGRDRAAWWPQTLVVLFLDLDGFKRVNDSLGHGAGDELLRIMAARLRACVRPEDTVARLGGDEFAILLANLVDEGWAILAAERITQALGAPIGLAERTVTVTTSVGIVLCTGEHARGDELLRDADVAMYQAKRLGPGRYAVFAPEMHAGALERLDLETDLRRAVDRDEFVVHYQPEVDIATGRIVGVEALARWQHPERGLLFPGEFIAAAEETGLIVPLGQQILAAACQQVRVWQMLAGESHALNLSVNLSARQLQHPDLVPEVTRTLHESGLAPGSLTLELTESTLLKEAETAHALLQQFRALGIRVAIDDFGTGYSSLVHLRRLPIDELKIDQTFIAGLGRDAADDGIVEAMVTLVSKLGLRLVAEGVETIEQRALLHELGCELGQGYFFAKPLAPSAMTALLNGGAHLPAPLGLVRSA